MTPSWGHAERCVALYIDEMYLVGCYQSHSSPPLAQWAPMGTGYFSHLVALLQNLIALSLGQPLSLVKIKTLSFFQFPNIKQ